MSPDEFGESVKSGETVISVVGLGRMGLATACLFLDVGARVVGVDSNRRVVELVSAGQVRFVEEGVGRILRKAISEDRFKATDRLGKVAAETAVILIVVPTGVDSRNRPDYSAVEKVCKQIGRGMQKGCLVVLESTVGIGVTERLVKGGLEAASGFQAGKDFGLAYSPIRASEGSALRDLLNYPRVIAATDDRSLQAASALFHAMGSGEAIHASSFEAAEAEKLFENVYRDVSLALTNELAVFCENAGLDYDEIVGMCNSQPYCHLLLPGAWVGGGCIPVNPYFLIEAGEYNNSKLRMARLARKVNDQLPSHIIRLVVRSLRDCGKSIRRAKVAVFGASYKADVKNLEYSPVHLLVERLAKKGAEVKVYDPFFTSEELKKAGLPAARGLKGTLEKADVLLITVAHGEFKKLNPRSIARLVKRPAAVIDCGYTLDPRRVEEEGMVFRRIGTGDYKRQEP